MESVLTPLQQAYLLGRSDRWSLGGIAMHDFREYRGQQLDVDRLQQRLLELIQHHDALRTCIDPLRLTQRVLPEARLNFELFDYTTLPVEAAEQRLAALRERYAHMCHDPQQPLWGVAAVKLPTSCPHPNVVFTSFDALILDGPGIGEITARLFDDQPLKPVLAAAAPVTFSEQQRQADAAWWQPRLQAMTTPAALPWQVPLAQVKVAQFRSQQVCIPREQLRKVGRLGSAEGLMRNSVLSALILDTLAFWSSDSEICVGVPVAFPAADNALSNQSSFIAVRYQRTEGTSLAARAQAFQEDVLRSLDHLAFSGVDLSQALSQQAQGGPALPVIITNCLSWETLSAKGDMHYHHGLTQTPQVAIDIRLMLDEQKNLLIRVDYVEQVLSASLITQFMTALEQRFQASSQQETLELPAAQFIDYRHYQRNTPESSAVQAPWLEQLSQRLFNATASTTALICDDQRWSYHQLGEQVKQLMAALQQRDIQAGEVVAICLPRGTQHISLALACVLQGIVWVPIDINSPEDRRAYLLENCQPALVIHHGQLNSGVTFEALLHPATPPARLHESRWLQTRSLSEDASYYLYTSGTTGKPKCVVLNNRATGNVIAQTVQRWQVSAQDVLISVTPPHHDMSMFDLFGALCSGATLVLPAAHQEKDAISWNQLVERYGVTIWCSVPAMLEMLLSCKTATSLASLRLVAQGGDYIKPATVAQLRTLQPDIQLYSLGGPTETTIWSIWHPIGEQEHGTVPYGEPLHGNQYFICHADGSHCPAGVVGRIHTSGVNLALGYLTDGELHQQDFVEVMQPDGTPVRTFRTGDQGYYRADGNIMFASRINGYVKIRGVRVSLPEIEEALAANSAIRDIVVVDYVDASSGDTCLGAFYLSEMQQPMSQGELRRWASHCLPSTHTPTRFIHATALPLSANGKTDRHQIRAQFSQPDAAAGPDLGQQIIACYASVIGKSVEASWNDETPFLALGLTLPHLRAVVQKLSLATERPLTVGQLLPCKNVADVKQLLRS